MKKLGKLSINPKKLIKNEELLNLRGGYEGSCSNGPMLECVDPFYNVLGIFCVETCNQDLMWICKPTYPMTEYTICW